MKRYTWILITVICCALALPLSMISSSQLGIQNAFATQNDPYSQDQSMTAKPAKKKRAHTGHKNAAKHDAVKKDAAEKKAPARMGRKFKKKNATESAPAPAVSEPALAPAVSE